jgi:succinate dehydrogenase / fumarate reductase iron-sulfur subunit
VPTDRLLNLLTYVKGYLDGTLTFRRSCAHGVCGSDAMVLNGVNRLACTVLMRDMLQKDGTNTTVTIAPLMGLPVEKDLVVGMEPFFSAYRQINPFLMTSGPEPTGGGVQSQADRARYDDTTKCILCACCTESCPVYWADGRFSGRPPSSTPIASFSTAATKAPGSGSTFSGGVDGVWGCRTTFNCTDACPRRIKVRQAITEVKRALLFNRKAVVR